MKNVRSFVLAVFLILVFAGVTSAMPLQWEDGNGHWYEVIVDEVDWETAKGEVKDGYHLATITSAAEQDFLKDLMSQYSGEFWLGAEQNLSAAAETAKNNDDINIAASGWEWVTGEAWDYTSWQKGEPNDWGGEEYHLGFWSRFDWNWNDEHGKSNVKGYVIESNAASVPEPASMFLFGSGLIALAGVRKKMIIK